MSEVISSFKSLRTGSQVFALLMVFVKIMLAVCMLEGYGGLNESGLCVFCELCPVSFLVVGESPSVLLWFVVISYVNCGNYG